ncbi:CPBP family intramembrane glutamic endopeptidase [Microbulbifer magnicolonia]|uniref:CPBP family intramembrane glutamic endopeptidase n=1 Tax=Microbulbifer magnicolonia TaxID=3109744 RepID=UPI002B4081F0|nr:CPBP family intramembrane glutamic endopeptidase [Microbulbifer sp. GG15]
MSQPGVETPGTFGLVMLLQLATLAMALAGIFFLDVRVSVLGASGFFALLIGALGALLSFAAALWLTRSGSGVGKTLRKHCRDLHPFFTRFSAPQIVLTAFAAGVCEELLFRGFLQPWLSLHSTPTLGIVGASIAFGLLHYASFTYFAATVLVGLILGITYRVTDSLLCVITWHALYDLLAITALARYPRLLGVSTMTKV